MGQPTLRGVQAHPTQVSIKINKHKIHVSFLFYSTLYYPSFIKNVQFLYVLNPRSLQNQNWSSAKRTKLKKYFLFTRVCCFTFKLKKVKLNGPAVSKIS